MKYCNKLILVVLVAACSSVTKEALVPDLLGNSYEWKIDLGDTIITQELHFFGDSLLTLVSENEGKKYAEFGRWKVLDAWGHASLFLSTAEGEFFFDINSGDGEMLKLSNDKYAYEAVKLPNRESSLSSDIQGSWMDPIDSFPSTIPDF